MHSHFIAILFHIFMMSSIYLWPIYYTLLVYFLYTGGLPRYATAAYLVFFYLDRDARNRGRKNPTCPRWLADNIADYFNAKIIPTAPLPPGKNYIIGVHPHGFACIGGSMLKARNIFGQRRLWFATHSIMFFVPFLREYGLMLGFISASFKNLFAKLTRNTDIVLVLFPGGVSEAINCGKYSENRLEITRHKGFCRLALMTGSALVPAFSFREFEVFRVLESARVLQDVFYRVFKFPLMNVASLPRRVDIRLVLGEPMQEEVDELQRRYIEAIVKIYDTYKGKYEGNPGVPLIIQ